MSHAPIAGSIAQQQANNRRAAAESAALTEEHARKSQRGAVDPSELPPPGSPDFERAWLAMKARGSAPHLGGG